MLLSILLVEIVSAVVQELEAAKPNMECAQEHELSASIHPHLGFYRLAREPSAHVVTELQGVDL